MMSDQPTATLAARRHLPSHWFALRMALYFSALFLIYGIHTTYFPVWLNWRGLSPEAIGFITAAPIFARALLTPVIAAWADARNNHRSSIIALSAASALLAILISQATTFWPIFLVSLPFAITIATIMPLTETIAVSGVRTAGHDYGRIRMWGSFTFLVTTVLSGVLVDAYGGGILSAVLIAAALLTAGASLLLPARAVPDKIVREVEVKPGAETGLLRSLLTKPLFVVFLLAMGAILGSHAAFYTFGALHLKAQGTTGLAFGGLWAVSVFAEIGLLAFSAPLVERFGPMKLVIAGAAAAVIRWGCMSIDPPYAVVVALQLLHALTYGAAHVGAIHFIAQAVPTRGAGTAQALYSAIGSGLITGAATLAAGHLYPHLAGQTFLVMAALAGAGLAAAIYIDKTWDRGPLLAGTS